MAGAAGTGRPNDPLGQLSRQLEEILVAGKLPMTDLTPERRTVIADPEVGVAHHFRASNQHCIEYNRQLAAAQAYRPLPIVRTLSEAPRYTTSIGEPHHPLRKQTAP